MSYGAVDLHSGACWTHGLDRAPARRVSHSIVRDGVRLRIPSDGLLSDAEARRLAWGILSDLAPDETIPVPDVVTYVEAQRLAVLRCLLDGEDRIVGVAAAMGWNRRTAERRLTELTGDGRVRKQKVSSTVTRFIAVVGQD